MSEQKFMGLTPKPIKTIWTKGKKYIVFANESDAVYAYNYYHFNINTGRICCCCGGYMNAIEEYDFLPISHTENI